MLSISIFTFTSIMSFNYANYMITVNDWCFCRAHGSEYCPVCPCDFRLVNNVHFEDELGEEAESFDLQERTPLNAYQKGAVSVRNSEAYKCEKHGTVDCGTCFDWVGQVKKEIEEALAREKWLKKRARLGDRFD